MKILAGILVILYTGLMLFAICREKSENISSALIGIGCLSSLAYLFWDVVYSKNLIIILISWMLCISAGTLANGIRQKNVHIHHHIIRFVVEAVITALCWAGR